MRAYCRECDNRVMTLLECIVSEFDDEYTFFCPNCEREYSTSINPNGFSFVYTGAEIYTHAMILVKRIAALDDEIKERESGTLEADLLPLTQREKEYATLELRDFLNGYGKDLRDLLASH